MTFTINGPGREVRIAFTPVEWDGLLRIQTRLADAEDSLQARLGGLLKSLDRKYAEDEVDTSLTSLINAARKIL